jgi:hypothetical protein
MPQIVPERRHVFISYRRVDRAWVEWKKPWRRRGWLLARAGGSDFVQSSAGEELEAFWEQILDKLALPATRMLLKCHARLLRLDRDKTVVGVTSNWYELVASRLPLLEQAMAAALGSHRTIVLQLVDASPAEAGTPS